VSKSTILINNFNSGELSPLIESRSDLSKFAAGCRKLENALPLIEGGAKKMPGSYFILSTKYPDKKSRAVPFAFSTTDTYVLEFGELYIRVFKNKGLVVDGSGNPVEIVSPYLEADLFDLDADTQSADVLYIFHRGYAPMTLSRSSDIAWTLTTLSVTGSENTSKVSDLFIPITSISKSNPCTVKYSSDIFTLSGGDKIYISSVAGMVQINQKVFTIAGSSLTVAAYDPTLAYTKGSHQDDPEVTVLPDVVSVGRFLAFDFGAGRILYISTPNPNDGYAEMVWDVQSNTADTLLITAGHISLAMTTSASNSADLIQTAIRALGSDYASWVVTENLTYSFDRPAAGVSIITETMSDAVAGIFQCIQNTLASTTNTNHFPPAESLYWSPSEVASSTSISLLGIDSTNWNTYIAGGIISKVVPLFNTPGDYPACGTFYEQRLMTAGSDNNPLRIRGSVQGDYSNFISDPNADDYAIQYDIVSGKQDRIRWLVGQQSLMLGTAGGVGTLDSGSLASALTQTNVNYKKQISTGVNVVHPQVVNDNLLWLTRSAKTVRLFQYVWQSNQWITPDLTRLSRHITIGATQALSGIKQTAFQSEPYPILWAVRNDGQLLGLTYESQEQVYAWFRIVTDGIIESVACISQDNDEDVVYIIVNRTLVHNTNHTLTNVRYMEYFKPQEIFSQIQDAFFVHCGLTYSGAATQTITGLNHLEGKTVAVLINGARHPDCIVTGGQIGLQWPTTDGAPTHIGLPVTTKILPMNPNLSTQQGTSRGSKQKINKAIFCFYETVTCKYGIDEDHLFDVPMGTGVTPALFTGDVSCDLEGNWDDFASIAIVDSSPFPLTLKAVVPQLSVNYD
jgi:hypothetical protein